MSALPIVVRAPTPPPRSLISVAIYYCRVTNEVFRIMTILDLPVTTCPCCTFCAWITEYTCSPSQLCLCLCAQTVDLVGEASNKFLSCHCSIDLSPSRTGGVPTHFALSVDAASSVQARYQINWPHRILTMLVVAIAKEDSIAVARPIKGRVTEIQYVVERVYIQRRPMTTRSFPNGSRQISVLRKCASVCNICLTRGACLSPTSRTTKASSDSVKTPF